MTTAQVVIGSGYGDEGKGLITDYLTNRESANIVVRFNGGAQAGHTVVTPDGNRHVFSHFSSGTFLGAKTFLSKDFIVNPLLFFKELEKLQSKNSNIVQPQVLIDPRALLSTPYDMIINQIKERYLSGNRHGSCGVGINETVERSIKAPNLNITTEHIVDSFSYKPKLSSTSRIDNQLVTILMKIRSEWVPTRLMELNIPYTPDMRDLVMSSDLLWNYLRDIETFTFHFGLLEAKDLVSRGKIIFEGAQGLALDQTHGNFPHVTRSNTGLKNVLEISEEAGIDNLEVYYVTRAYATKHGAGDFPHELINKPYIGINEITNISNEFQGNFRYGHLDINLLRNRIKTDLEYAVPYKIKVNPKLAITCVDQVDKIGKYIINGKLKKMSKRYMASLIAKDIGLPYYIESRGPTRNDVISEKISL